MDSGAVQESSKSGFSAQINLPQILTHAVCGEFVRNKKREFENYQLSYKISEGNKFDISNIEITSPDSDETLNLLRQLKGFQQSSMKHFKKITDFEIKKVLSYCFKIAKDKNGVQDVFVKEHDKNTLLMMGQPESIDKFEDLLDNFLNLARQDDTEDRFTRKTRYQKLLSQGFKTLMNSDKTFFVIFNDENGLLKGELIEETKMEKIEQNFDVVCIQERFGDNVYNYEY